MNCKLRLAITGGMGSGKSIVAHAMSVMGVPVYDCDSRAKELMVSDPYIVKELKRMMGDDCYLPDGSLNRSYLASRIFTDDSNINRVNSLVHPVVKKDFMKWSEMQATPVVAVETAILYESGMVDVVDKILVVWAEYETAVARSVRRSSLSRSQVVSRMQKQMSADELLLLSDYSIFNDNDSAVLPEIVSLLAELDDLSAEFAHKILK
jgi:dephospho-CoA kinase